VVSNELRWLPEAVAEAEEARDWYAARSPLAARGFLLELESAVRAIHETPSRWPVHLHGTRRFLFSHHYPFSLVYRLGPPVEIVSVAHSKRRPGFWRPR
jgi:plasmid stabilization system protein ParE